VLSGIEARHEKMRPRLIMRMLGLCTRSSRKATSSQGRSGRMSRKDSRLVARAARRTTVVHMSDRHARRRRREQTLKRSTRAAASASAEGLLVR